MNDSDSTITRSTRAFLSGTMLSRITGVAREISMAFVWGTSSFLAAFLVAFRFASLLRRLFGEGAFAASFAPHFERARARSCQEGAIFFRDLFVTLAIALFVLIGGGEALGILIMKRELFSSEVREVIRLILYILPGVFFICLFGVTSSLQGCERRFFLPAVSPALFNLIWIGAIWILAGFDQTIAMPRLALTLSAGYLIQVAVTMRHPFCYLREHLSVREILKPRPFSKAVRTMSLPLLLTLIGVGATQINSALDGLFARAASLEGPAYLWYAIRLEQLPLALFGIAISSTILPPFSRAAAADNHEEFRTLFVGAMRRAFGLTFPSMVAIFVLGLSAVNLLYGHGQFTKYATLSTAQCLWGYGVGLVPASLSLILAPAFYAKKKFSIPTSASFISVLLNVGLNALFVFHFKWGAESIAIATSIAALFQMGVLLYFLRRKMDLFSGDLLRYMGRVAFCSLFAGAVTLGAMHKLLGEATLSHWLALQVALPRYIPGQLMHFGLGFLFFLAVLYAATRLFRVDDMFDLFRRS